MRNIFQRLFYDFSRVFFHVLFFFWFRFSIEGRDNLPKKGAYVFASNHASHLDPVICGVVNRRQLLFLAKKELFRNRFFAWLISLYNVFPIERGKGDIKAIKIGLNRLKSGEPMMLYPEGTRSEDGSIGEAKRGIGFILEKSGVPVLPCYIYGSGQALRKNSKMVYPVKISVHIGKPLVFDDIRRSSVSREEKQIRIAGEVIQAIRNLKTQMETQL